jgi:1-acyl-sn-glycerol-3-phosphate acyltransferase
MDVAARLSTAEALRPRRLRRRKPIQFSASDPEGVWGDVLGFRPLGGRIRAARRLVSILVWTLIAIPTQAVLLLLPGRAKIAFPKVYWGTLCRLIGLRIQVVGEAARDRPVLFVSNHSSWLDIPVLGAVLEACFVAKAEVGTGRSSAPWPGSAAASSSAAIAPAPRARPA